jgi:GNAT superfamily N-acetyltransferase
MDIIIRVIENEDAKAVAALSEQLGYAISTEDTAVQISMINKSETDAAYVAVDGKVVIGWIHIFYALRLESQAFCEVAGLVVDKHCRGIGIGNMLLKKAIDWGNSKTCKRLVVRSNAKRNDAHKFYANLGFKEIKQQKVFELPLI